MDVGGRKPSSLHGGPGSACKAHLSGSLLAAMLARGWGQSAPQAGPAPSSLFLFPGPSSKTRGGVVGAKLSEWGCVCAFSYWSPERELATWPHSRLHLHLGPPFPPQNHRCRR